jgi:hypothetical protein
VYMERERPRHYKKEKRHKDHGRERGYEHDNGRGNGRR